MLSMEYVRSLNCNYERILLDKKPEEKKYQYCILSRGGIKGLLLCDLRYINGNAYLYYDISSKQNVEQLYSERTIDREWFIDFVWSVNQIHRELERFLLDARNLVLTPAQVFQDLETKAYFFLYIPYYEGEATFGKFMNFMLEHLDYEDEGLVECVYRMNEEWELYGEEYLRNKIYEDVKALEKMPAVKVDAKVSEDMTLQDTIGETENVKESVRNIPEKKGLFGILEGKKNRNKKMREEYRQSMQQEMLGYAVAEETIYGVKETSDEVEEEYGKTVYIEEKELQEPEKYRLFAPDGSLLKTLEKASLSIGKKKDEADLALEDNSVSRLHARIIIEQGTAYLEDLNSTNGTFKNGIRLRPYEKRRLDQGDEIKCGKVMMIFRY